MSPGPVIVSNSNLLIYYKISEYFSKDYNISEIWFDRSIINKLKSIEITTMTTSILILDSSKLLELPQTADDKMDILYGIIPFLPYADDLYLELNYNNINENISRPSISLNFINSSNIEPYDIIVNDPELGVRTLRVESDNNIFFVN